MSSYVLCEFAGKRKMSYMYYFGQVTSGKDEDYDIEIQFVCFLKYKTGRKICQEQRGARQFPSFRCESCIAKTRSEWYHG